MGYPEYGTPSTELDPVKAHAAYCAAIASSGKDHTSEYEIVTIAERIEQYLRGGR